LYDIETNEYFVSRDVNFSETNFPFTYLPKEDLPTISGLGGSDVDLEEFDYLKIKMEQDMTIMLCLMQYQYNMKLMLFRQ